MQPATIGRGWFAALLLIAFATRLGAALAWQSRLPADQPFKFGDSQSYWTLADAVRRDQPYRYGEDRVFRAPGYPLLLAGWLTLWGADDPPIWWGRMAGVVCGTVTVGLVASWGTALCDARTGLWAGWLACFYPGAIGMSVFILSEALFCPLMILHLHGWLRATRAPTAGQAGGWSLWGGLWAGLATLTRPSWLLVIPFAAVISQVARRDRPRQALIAGCMLLAVCLTMTPWWLRNYRVTGRFVPTTLQTGASLYDGLNPQATGASDMGFSLQFRQALRAEDRAAAQPADSPLEVRLDAALRRAALDWALADPGRVVQLMGIKLLRFWNPLPNADEFRGWLPRLIVVAGYLPILLLAVVGTATASCAAWTRWMLWMPMAYFSLLHTIFVSSIRYRQPAMLLLTILAAAAITAVLERRAAAAAAPQT